MQIDRPDVVAEVTAAFTDYEDALVADEADRVVGFFAPAAVRFGIADQQAGLDEQLAWRRAQPPLPPGAGSRTRSSPPTARTSRIVTTLFGYPGSDVLGRQSQTWVRLPQGWRIVTAHVSHPA